MTIVFDEETARVEMTIQDETEEMLVAAGTSLINVRRININDFEWCAQVSPPSMGATKKYRMLRRKRS